MKRKRSRRVALSALLALVTGLSCAGERRSPNVVLVVLDTLRADRLGSYGSERGLTPFLDELAERGAVFGRSYAPTSWTPPSVASLLTSRHPLQHRIAEFESRLAGDELTLAERLAERGYRTVGVSANRLISSPKGFAQGFFEWRTLRASRLENGRLPKVRADTVNAVLLAWLDDTWTSERPEPVFVYLHYMDPHSPYLPPEPFRSRFGLPEATTGELRAVNRTLTELRFRHLDERQVRLLASLYDAEVAALDAALRRLFDALEERGFLEDAVVVVVADHGEEFREHGMLLHGLNLHEESIRVPLLVLAPGLAGGQVIQQNVSLLDVAPTILELAGAGGEERFEGRSLVPLLWPAGRAAKPRGRPGSDFAPADLILELAPKKAGLMELRSHSTGILRGSRKLLVDPRGGITRFDLELDPAERAPRLGDLSEEDAALLEALQRARATLGEGEQGGGRIELDEETREALRELGYAP